MYIPLYLIKMEHIIRPVNNKAYGGIKVGSNSVSFFHPFYFEEIKGIIKLITSKNTAGTNKISPKLLKYISDFVAPPLCHVLNIPFLGGSFQSEMEFNRVRPSLIKK